jgi:hypothetical protein
MDKKREADDLLAEITGGSLANPDPDTIDQASEDNNGQDDKSEDYLSNKPEEAGTENGSTPPDPTPQIVENFGDPTTHTIPDKQSAPISETPPLSVPNTEGEGVSNFWDDIEKSHTETPPLIDSGSPTPPVDTSNPNWREV